MSAQEIPLLIVSPEEHERIARQARMHGYDTPDAYIRALIEADETDEDDIDYIRESIKQGLREALRGEGIPIDELWDTLDDD